MDQMKAFLLSLGRILERPWSADQLEQARVATRNAWVRDDLPEWEAELGPALGELHDLLEMTYEGNITHEAVCELHVMMMSHFYTPSISRPSERMNILNALERIIIAEGMRDEGRGYYVRKTRLTPWMDAARGVKKGFGPACGALRRNLLKPGKPVKHTQAVVWLLEMFEYVRAQEESVRQADLGQWGELDAERKEQAPDKSGVEQTDDSIPPSSEVVVCHDVNDAMAMLKELRNAANEETRTDKIVMWMRDGRLNPLMAPILGEFSEVVGLANARMQVKREKKPKKKGGKKKSKKK